MEISLAPDEALFIGICNWDVADFAAPIFTNASVQAGKPLPNEDVLALDDWQLVIESWGPADNAAHEFETEKARLELGQVDLTTWDLVPVDDQLLQQAGVDSMAHLAGIGYYTTTFSNPEGWSEGQSAILVVENSDDMVVSITINGTTLEGIDPAKNQVEIGSFLQAENALEIKLATTLINRVRVEHEIFKSGFAFPPAP